MSVVLQVFLTAERMPTPQQWAAAVRAHGFDMDLDTDFHVHDSTGFRRCKYKGHDAGFEYYFDAVDWNADPDESDEGIREAIGGRDSFVSLVTHSSWHEFATSVIASGVLCAISDGVLIDVDEPISASAAIAWAKDGERAVEAELNK